MSKILFLTSRYLPTPSANGINTNYIVQELKERGHTITCISLKEENEKTSEVIGGVPIYRLNPSNYSKLIEKESKIQNIYFKKIFAFSRKLMRSVKLFFLLYKFPDNDISQSKNTYNLLNSIHEREKFDCVIGVFKPYSNIAALIEFKKKNSDIICGGYYLDLISSSPRPRLMPQVFYDYLCFRGDMRAFNTLDFLMVARSGKSIYNNSKYDNVRGKIEYIDFPTFNQLSTNAVSVKKSDSVELVYAGTLNQDYRNPEYLLKCLKATQLKIKLHIFGKGNCEEILNKYNNGNLTILNNGLVSQETVQKFMLSADAVVNISNSIPNAVPSKIFEMFALGKPIINLVFHENDNTKEYFEKYPAVINVKKWLNINDQVVILTDFLKEESGKIYNLKEIKENFIENTPPFTASIIEKRISNFYKSSISIKNI